MRLMVESGFSPLLKISFMVILGDCALKYIPGMPTVTFAWGRIPGLIKLL
jgi:hypothetical protein